MSKRKAGMYPTCRVILGYDDKGHNLLCGQKTLDGSPYCIEHDGEDDLLEPWDSEEHPDDEYKTVTDELDD